MHDPMVVVFDVKWPRPKGWRLGPRQRQTAGVRRRRYNPDAQHRLAGQAMKPWWRPAAWEVTAFGRRWAWTVLLVVWHHEPGGADSGTTCKGMGGSDLTWANMVWAARHWRHLSVQVPAAQQARARLFDRCALCGRGGRPNISHQWESPPLGWRKWRSRPGLYHPECSELVHARRQLDQRAEIVREIVRWASRATGRSEARIVNLVAGSASGWPFLQAYEFARLMGYEYSDGGRGYVKADAPRGAL